MNFKPFFVHYHLQSTEVKWRKNSAKNNPIGFTLYVSPGAKDRHITVSGAWCNAKDKFTKSIGRNQAKNHAEIKEINARHLGTVLAAMRAVVQGYDNVTISKTNSNVYDYVYRYMI